MTGDRELRYRDQRKLQGLRLLENDDDLARLMADLGPDAATVARAEFRDRLTQRDRRLKLALMDQSLVAGLGNLLIDEVLWRARLHPSRTTRELTASEHHRLHRRMQAALRTASARAGIPTGPRWLTGVRDADNPRCPRCNGKLHNDGVGGRRTVWCPRCQSTDQNASDH